MTNTTRFRLLHTVLCIVLTCILFENDFVSILIIRTMSFAKLQTCINMFLLHIHHLFSLTGQKYEPEPYLPPVTDPSPVPPPSPTKSKKGGGEKGDKSDRKSEKGSATPEPQVHLVNDDYLVLS